VLDTLLTEWSMPLIWTGIGMVVLMLISPGRALIGFVLNQIWRLSEWVFGVVINALQAWLVKILKAHMVVFRNLMPRVSVLPSVAKETVRKD